VATLFAALNNFGKKAKYWICAAGCAKRQQFSPLKREAKRYTPSRKPLALGKI
jgi:hypothetical protein